MKPNLIDWMIYRLFYWRWNKILTHNDRLLEIFRLYVDTWSVRHGAVIPKERTIKGASD